MKNYQNNSAEVMEQIKAYIRNAGIPMTAYSAEALSRADNEFCDISLEFINEEIDCRVMVYVRANKSWAVEEDAAGNTYRVHQVSASVNWSAYGSTEPKLAAARLAFMQSVASFAVALEEAFPHEFYTLKQTAEERALNRATNAAVSAAKAHTKGLRVSGQRAVAAPAEASLNGEYPFEVEGRRFVATVAGSTLLVSRLS